MSANGKSKSRNLLITVILVLAVASVFVLRFRQLGEGEALASIRSVQETEGIPVETVTVRRGSVARWITLAGTVEGRVQYPVVSSNALQVVGIPVQEGDRVAPGDVIIHLATGAPSPMYHSVAKSRAGYQNALLNAQRLRNLYAEGAVSKAELDQAETTLKVLAADLEDAEGSSALTATEPGVVSSILVREGDTVKAGKALAWITDTDEVKIKFSAGSSQALRLRTGQEAVLEAPDGTRRTGAVSRLDLMADPLTHLLDGEARFDNGDGLLVPGVLVSFQVRTAGREDVLILPLASLVQDGKGVAVWVIPDDGKARLVPVETGLKNEDQVEIVRGLAEGRQVVLRGQTLLSEGVPVKVVGAGEDR